MLTKHPRLIGGLSAAVLLLSLGGVNAYAADGVSPTPVQQPATAGSTPTANPAQTGMPGNPDGSCPETAPFKVSKSGIYHTPEDTNYKNTKAKRCFASGQAAEQAGYRAPKPSVKSKP